MKVGVVVMLDYKPMSATPRRYREIRALARAAEHAGFDSIWLYDHLLYRFENVPITIGIWECWTMLSALAEATHKVTLGTLVNCALFRNPALLAKMAATLDEVSGGRLILGLGAGWHQPEFDAFGYPFDHRVDRFEEALQIIRPLLKEGKVDFQGKYYQARECELAPRVSSPGGVPLLIGASGPRMLRLAAAYGDLWNSGYLHAPDSFNQPDADFKQACADIGRDPACVQPTAMVAARFPDLGDANPGGLEHWLSGTPQELAQALRGYQALGVAHVMFHFMPHNRRALDVLAEALSIYRGG